MELRQEGKGRGYQPTQWSQKGLGTLSVSSVRGLLLLLLLSRFSRVRLHSRQPTRLPVPGILQATTLEWVAISFSNSHESEIEVAQLCLTLLDPMDHSLPGSSVHGIFQARVLEWVAIAFSTVIGQFRSN